MTCKKDDIGKIGWLLNDAGSQIFDMIAGDLNRAAGTEVNYYSIERGKGKFDPLYGEYKERVFEGPWRLPGKVTMPQQTPRSDESGYTVEFDADCTIARVHFDENNAPYPIEGDVVEFWRTAYHDVDSRGRGLFFDVIKVLNDGHVNDTATFVQFKLILKRRPQFTPERRIDEDKDNLR